jgi:NADH-quinone oxidoreductase subunit C
VNLPGATPTVEFGQLTLDVPAGEWVAAATALRDGGLTCFDWLTAVDELAEGFDVVLAVYSVDTKERVRLRTRVTEPVLPTLTGVWAGAGWHEREVTEMFGIAFAGHPDPAPLLLPDGFEGHPLRKDFVLAARAAREWPGGREPGESTPSRNRRLRPLGVPEDWSG